MRKLIRIISIVIAVLLFANPSFADYEAVKIEGAVCEGVKIGEVAAGVIFVSEVADTSFAGVLRGTAGKVVTVNWGDGNKENVTFSGVGVDDNISHDYGVAGNFIISLTGDLGDLTTIEYAAQKLSKFYLPSILINLTYLSFYYTRLTTGTTAELKVFANLTHLDFFYTAVTGTTADLRVLTNLTYLSFTSSNVTGTTADLRVLTNLTYLSFSKTAVIGDLGELRALTSLETLYAYSLSGTSYTAGALPDSWKMVQVQDNAWTSTEVDNFIIDLDTPGRVHDGTLNIAGTNAARTSASDEAKQHLIDKGWTITVNE